jgi:hypothetical protein
MNKFTKFLPVMLIALFVSMAYSQSLGDLANKEKERREAIKNDRVITDEEAAKYKSEPETAKRVSDKNSAQSDDQESQGDKTDTAEQKGKDAENMESTDFQGRPESFWRKTMTAAYESVSRLENEANVLVLKLNGLQDLFYKEADGFRRETVQREIQKTYYEQDLNKQKLEKARVALQDLENEARKSGALPGWIERK